VRLRTSVLKASPARLFAAVSALFHKNHCSATNRFAAATARAPRSLWPAAATHTALAERHGDHKTCSAARPRESLTSLRQFQRSFLCLIFVPSARTCADGFNPKCRPLDCGTPVLMAWSPSKRQR
jgi:hypothetical protein